MINTIKKLGESLIAKIIVGIIIISFMAWGVSGVFIGQDVKTIASYGNQVITINDLQNAMQRDVSQINESDAARQKQNGTRLTVAKWIKIGGWTRSLSTLIRTSAFDQAVSDLNITIPDEAVIQYIRKDPVFFSMEGKFSKKIFQAILANNHYSEDSYVRDLRRFIGRQVVQKALVNNVVAPKILARLLYQAQYVKTSVDYIVVSPEDVPSFQATEKKLHTFYKKYIRFFKTQERRDIEIVALSQKFLIPQQKKLITSIMIEQYYRDHHEEYFTPEKRLIERFDFKKFDVAQTTLRKLKEKQLSIANLLKKLKTNEEDVSLGYVEKKNLLDKNEANIAFSIKNKSFSNLIKYNSGYYILYIKHIMPSTTVSLKKARPSIILKLATEMTKEHINNLRDDIESDRESSNENLSVISKKYNIPLYFYKNITINGMKKNGNMVKNSEYLLSVVQKVFSIKSPQTYVPSYDIKHANRSDTVIFANVVKIYPSVKKSFDKSKALVKDFYIEKTQDDWIATKAKSALQEIIQKKLSMQEVAEKEGWKVRTGSFLASSININDKRKDKSALTEIFQNKKAVNFFTQASVGECVPVIGPKNRRKIYIVCVTKNSFTPPKQKKKAYMLSMKRGTEETEMALSTGLSDNLKKVFLDNLLNTYHVRIRQKTIQQFKSTLVSEN